MIDDDYEPANDYEDQMDGLAAGIYKHDDLYCKHGTFVGNWAGPDYMCGPCEMGVTDEEWREAQEAARIANEKRRAAREKWDQLVVDSDQETLLRFLQSKEGEWLFR